VELQEDALYRFEIDSAVAPTSDAIFNYQDTEGQEYLIYFNDLQNSLLFFSLKTREIVKEVSLNFEGPNGVGNVRGFHVQSFDSIFITPSGGGIIHLVNGNGSLLETYNYNNHPSFSGTFKSRSKLSTPLVKVGNLLYILQFPPSPYNQIPVEKFENASLGFTIDLLSNEVVSLDSKYPGEYWDNGYYPPYLARQFDGKSFVYCFNYSSTIYANELGTSNLIPHKLKLGIPPFDEHNLNTIEESIRYRLKSPWIVNLLYDKYREIYYLIYYPGDPDQHVSDYQNFSSQISKFRIYVLDKEFRKIGYKVLGNSRYLVDNMFVASEGLFISLNNEFSDLMDEDYLKFQLFKIVE
jgi:hypothetical protein